MPLNRTMAELLSKHSNQPTDGYLSVRSPSKTPMRPYNSEYDYLAMVLVRPLRHEESKERRRKNQLHIEMVFVCLYRVVGEVYPSMSRKIALGKCDNVVRKIRLRDSGSEYMAYGYLVWIFEKVQMYDFELFCCVTEEHIYRALEITSACIDDAATYSDHVELNDWMDSLEVSVGCMQNCGMVVGKGSWRTLFARGVCNWRVNTNSKEVLWLEFDDTQELRVGDTQNNVEVDWGFELETQCSLWLSVCHQERTTFKGGGCHTQTGVRYVHGHDAIGVVGDRWDTTSLSIGEVGRVTSHVGGLYPLPDTLSRGGVTEMWESHTYMSAFGVGEAWMNKDGFTSCMVICLEKEIFYKGDSLISEEKSRREIMDGAQIRCMITMYAMRYSSEDGSLFGLWRGSLCVGGESDLGGTESRPGLRVRMTELSTMIQQWDGRCRGCNRTGLNKRLSFASKIGWEGLAESRRDGVVETVSLILKAAGNYYHWSLDIWNRFTVPVEFFIKDFSKISRPMTHLLEKNTPFIFSEECIQAFQTLKKKLTEAPILIAPDWDQPFELMCDAGDYAIAARLGCAETKVATWDDLAFKLIILGWNVRILQKSQENGQTRANSDTGTKEHTKSQENAIKDYVYKIASTSNTSRSGEGIMQLTALEDELRSTKVVYNKSLITLTKRVKKLENNSSCKRSTIVNSTEDEKAKFGYYGSFPNRGGMIDEFDQDENVKNLVKSNTSNNLHPVVEVRKNMCMYLKNKGGYKLSHFKGMKYEDIRPIIERVWDQNLAFVPKDSEIEKEVMKRSRIDQGLGSTSGIRAFALRNFDLEVMEFESAHSNTTAKLPILKLDLDMVNTINLLDVLVDLKLRFWNLFKTTKESVGSM
ncbi:reverse transcriptase domain-containing protein [Tanacetum coccineum]